MIYKQRVSITRYTNNVCLFFMRMPFKLAWLFFLLVVDFRQTIGSNMPLSSYSHSHGHGHGHGQNIYLSNKEKSERTISFSSPRALRGPF